MSVPEKASTSLKYGLFRIALKNTPNIKRKTTVKPNMAGMRLLIRSVRGSACPIPPQIPHGSPANSLPFSSCSFTQTAQENSLVPFLQVPTPEQ